MLWNVKNVFGPVGGDRRRLPLAMAIATLMNARGMVELILVNLGLQRGLITPTMFTMLVLMAIGTTVMTGPVFSLIWEREDEPAVGPRLAADRAPLA